MKHIENLHEILDEIIDKQHGIVTSMINMAKLEIGGKSAKQLEKGLLELEFKNLKSSYIKLRDAMSEYKIEEYKTGIDLYSSVNVTVDDQIEAQKDDRMIINVREEVLDYIKDSYESMQFIENEETEETSIYDGEDYEPFRNLEYEMYKYNISSIESKDDLDNSNMHKLSNQYRSTIIADISEREAYEKAIERIQNIIDLTNENDVNCRFSKEEAKRIRTKLIYQKYEEKFKLLNNQYNGILTEDLVMFKYLDFAMKNGSLPLALGLSEDDYNRFKNQLVRNYLQLVDDDIESVIIPEKEEEEDKEIAEDITEEVSLDSDDDGRE
jgi:hypothetical protein